MIDWLKLRLWIPAAGRIPGDLVCIFTPDGELKWQKVKAAEIGGSYESNVHAYACPVTGRLVIDGNPVKFFQGHNIFGTDDIHGLSRAISAHVIERLQLEVTESELHDLERGDIELARVDLTGMYSVGSLDNARAAVRALGDRATLRHRGRGTLGRDGTAYWGKHSRRSATKAYAKGHELLDHKLPKGIPHGDALIAFAQDKLRIEHVLRGMELKARQLDRVIYWESSTAAMLYSEMTGKLSVPDNIELSPTMLEGLSPRLRLAYAAWLRGDDLRATLPRKTFYRYRKQLLEVGVDIVTLRPAEARASTLQLVNIINAVPVGVPDWAHGTPVYYQPPRRRAA